MAESSSISIKNDTELLQGCSLGKAGYWDEFLRRYGRLIRATVDCLRRRYGVHNPETDDLVGHTIEKLLESDCRRLQAWRGESKFSTYLALVTRNACIDYLRKNNKGRRMEPVDEAARWLEGRRARQGQDILDDRIKMLRRAMGHLTTKQAMIMKLRLAGKTLREIASTLRIPEGTVSAENSRAIKRLRDLMTSSEGRAESSSGERL